MSQEITECPDDGYAIADGRCIACARTPADVLADRAASVDEPTGESDSTIVPNWQKSRIARYSRELAERSDAERAELAGAPSLNAGAYAPDARPLAIGETLPDPVRPEREPSTEWLMRGPETSGSGGSKGRSRSSRKPIICGEPCDCGSGLPCRFTMLHDTHSCAECRGESGAGRPRIEPGVPRNIHVTGRISERTAAAIEQTGKSTATIMYELGRAIIEGRPYDWRKKADEA